MVTILKRTHSCFFLVFVMGHNGCHRESRMMEDMFNPTFQLID